MRHCRPAQCRQVHAVQCADADRGGAGGELSLLHHRAQCRRRGGARRAPGQARGDRQIGRRSFRPASPSSTSRAWCAAPPRARAWAISSSPISAKSMPSCMCCAVSRTTTSPMSREDRSGVGRRDGRDRIDAGRSGKPRKRVKPLEKKAKTGEKEAKELYALMMKALDLLREGKPAREAGAHARSSASPIASLAC